MIEVLATAKKEDLPEHSVQGTEHTHSPEHDVPSTDWRHRIASRAAKEIQDGFYVNLGVGIPTLVPEVGFILSLQVVCRLPHQFKLPASTCHLISKYGWRARMVSSAWDLIPQIPRSIRK